MKTSKRERRVPPGRRVRNKEASLVMKGFPRRTMRTLEKITEQWLTRGKSTFGNFWLRSVGGKKSTAQWMVQLPSALGRIVALTVLVVGTVSNVAAYRYLSQQALTQAHTNFLMTCKDVQQAIDIRLHSYAQILLGLRGLFAHSPTLSREEFSRYLAQLDISRQFPAVSAVDYAEYFLAASKDSFERKVRADVSLIGSQYPKFEISPPGDRPNYLVVTYVEPFAKNAMMLGVDLQVLGRPDRFARLRDSGQITSSGRIVPLSDGYTVGMGLALYEQGVVPDSPEARRDAFRGSVGLRFSLIGLLREAVPGGTRLRILIYSPAMEGSGDTALPGASQASLLFDSRVVLPSQAALVDARSAIAGLIEEFPAGLGGMPLLFRYEAAVNAFSSPMNRVLPSLVFALGVAASVLLASLVYLFSRTQTQLKAAVTVRTEELHRINQQLHDEMAERVQLESELLKVAEEERKRLGTELHDDLGQRLTAVAFIAESLAQHLSHRDAFASNQASKMGTHLSDAIGRIRLLAKAIYPLTPEAANVAVALEQLSDEVREVYGLECEIKWSGAVAFDESVSLHVYRIVQEAIRNAIQHGHASAVKIELSANGDKPRIVISDNGLGFNELARNSNAGIGLAVMRHRCHIIGLGFVIRRGQNGGMVLSIG